MTVDSARRTRRRAPAKSADSDATIVGSELTAPAATRTRRAATKTTIEANPAVDHAVAPADAPAPAPAGPAAPAEPAAESVSTAPQAAVGMRMPSVTPPVPPPSAVSASAMFRSTSPFAQSPDAPLSLAPTPSAHAPAPATSLSIGELDQTIFDCPACSRPLALGARRCPGCKTRLLNGVVLRKASGFAAVGLAVGVLAGAGGGFLLGSSTAAVAGAGIVASGPSSAPSSAPSRASVIPSVAPTSAPTVAAPTPPSDVPTWTRSALLQVLATNGRLTTAAADLRSALKAPVFDASAVAQTLRTISADSVFGQQLAERVAGWSGSGALGPDLVDYYARIHETAANGLLASVRNATAYHDAATAMLALIAKGPSIDDAVRATAASVGLDLGVPSSPAAP